MVAYLTYHLSLLKKSLHSLQIVFLIGLYVVLFLTPLAAGAQQYDLLIKNGHVIDPKNHINAKKDVAIADGKIAKVADDISAAQSKKIIDATGLFVVPGLIDIHTHGL